MKNFRFLIAAALVLTGCSSLPRELSDNIAAENQKLEAAQKQLKSTQAALKADFASAPDLYSNAPVTTEWPARLNAAQTKLDRANEDRQDLQKLKSGDRESILKAERLLSDERRLRQPAADEISKVEAEAANWRDFRANLPRRLAKMQQSHDALGKPDLAPVSATVARAEKDWPAKKPDLDSRLNALKSAPDRIEQRWQATTDARQAAAAGKASGTQLAALIVTDSELTEAATGFARNTREIEDLSAQLYDSWDKILEDLEAHAPSYREKLKIVRTHFVDVPSKKTETTSEQKWIDISPAAYAAVENDLGMAISHKDAGLYDSEAQNIPQPAGFAYIAPPDVGRNQYGYWTHNEQGSFWTFLPEYLIMRELFWGGNSYRPIVVNEYNSYYGAVRSGRSYYGEAAPNAPPKYGTHGTFTRQTYANSRYVQSPGYKSSGYKSSGYASNPAPAAAPAASTPRSDGSQGKRFGWPSAGPGGDPAGAEPAGRRFGTGSGSPQGRRFGNPGGSPAPRSAPRGFGSRRR